LTFDDDVLAWIDRPANGRNVACAHGHLDLTALVVVHRRFDGADGLAWRFLAMHAGNWLEALLRAAERAMALDVDAQPVHIPP
jgi:hypothetical protein